jgi:serine protease Do
MAKAFSPQPQGPLAPEGKPGPHSPGQKDIVAMRLSVPLAARLVMAVALTVPALTVPRGAVARGTPDSFADLAEQLLPAVVNISSTQNVQTASSDKGPEMPVFPPGSPFEQFFKDFMNRHGQGGGQGGGGDGDNNDQDQDQDGGPDQGQDAHPGHPHRMQSLGSGFIIDPSGIIVTNNHVIDGADEITVILQDNTSLKATLIGHDDKNDLAVLQVHTTHKLPAVHWGDSDKSRVGDWVLAIGNPFGLGGSVTAGIVSARGRDIQQGPYDDFIQTDAAINKGNSGGPLFNMNGDVIGINTAIFSPSGGSIGIGFSIPSDEAKNVVEQLRQYGRPRRGWLGVHIQQVTPDIAESLGLHAADNPTEGSAEGALVAGVTHNGPADHAHIQNGDIILTFNNQPLKEMKTLPRVVAETPIDQQVPVDIWRAGHRQTVQVVVAEMPDDEKKPAAAAESLHKPATNPSVDFSGFGMKLSPLTDATRQKYKIDAEQKGMVITEISPDGAAADHGLKPGDVVVEVSQSAVNSPADLQKKLDEARNASRKSVLLLVQGQDGLRWVPMPVPKKG